MATITRFFSIDFGPAKSGLSTVGYTLTGQTRVTAGVSEEPAGSGGYGALVSYDESFQGKITWDTGDDPIKYGFEDINPGDEDGQTVGASQLPAGTVTVSGVKSMLADTCGAMVTKIGFDGSAASDWWLTPIAYGVLALGETVADFPNVSDGDLSVVSQNDLPKLLLVAEVRALENILGNNLFVDQQVSMGAQKLGQLRDWLEKAIARKKQELRDTYGLGLSSVSASTIDLGFASAATDPWVYG